MFYLFNSVPGYIQVTRHDLTSIHATIDVAENMADGREWIKDNVHNDVENASNEATPC